MDTRTAVHSGCISQKVCYLQNIQTVTNNIIQHTHALLMQSRLSKYFDVMCIYWFTNKRSTKFLKKRIYRHFFLRMLMMKYGRRFMTLYRRQWSRSSPRKRNAKKSKWLSEKALQITVKRIEVKIKGEKERYTNLNGRKWRRTRAFWWKWKRRVKVWLKAQHSEKLNSWHLVPSLHSK